MVCYLKTEKMSLNVKFIKEKEVLINRTIVDDAQYQKINKNWLDRQNIGFLRNT